MSTLTGIGKDALARVVAADIPPGSFVNLGIGLPTKIPNYLAPGSGVLLPPENGLPGLGPGARVGPGPGAGCSSGGARRQGCSAPSPVGAVSPFRSARSTRWRARCGWASVSPSWRRRLARPT